MSIFKRKRKAESEGRERERDFLIFHKLRMKATFPNLKKKLQI